MRWTTEERQQLASRQVTTAMCKYLDRHVIGVILESEGVAQCIGSGTGIKIDGRYFIVSAGHMLMDAKKNKWDMVLTGRGQPSPEVSSFLGYGCRLDEFVDIAWIELDPESANSLSQEFVALNYLSISICYLENDLAMVNGYQRDLIRIQPFHERRKLTLKPLCFQTLTLHPNVWSSEFNDAIDILLKYPEEGCVDSSGKPINLPEPYGISGGGIWALDVNCEGIWAPSKAKLIGIEHSWDPSEHYLRATQIQHWLQMLKEDVPELLEIITDTAWES